MRSKHVFFMCCLCMASLMYAQVDTNWVFTFDGGVGGNYRADDIIYAPDGNIYVSGIFDNGPNDDIGILSLSPAGDTNWTCVYNGPSDNEDWSNDILFADAYIYMTGVISNANRDFGILCISALGDPCSITLTVYDATGSKMRTLIDAWIEAQCWSIFSGIAA